MEIRLSTEGVNALMISYSTIHTPSWHTYFPPHLFNTPTFPCLMRIEPFSQQHLKNTTLLLSCHQNSNPCFLHAQLILRRFQIVFKLISTVNLPCHLALPYSHWYVASVLVFNPWITDSFFHFPSNIIFSNLFSFAFFRCLLV